MIKLFRGVAVNDQSTRHLTVAVRLMHLGLVVTCVAAWLTGEIAEPEGGEALGYLIHSTLGLVVGGVLILRVLYGLIGPGEQRFSYWLPVTPQRIRMVIDDMLSLLTLKLPEREGHQGIAGAVQAFGLLVFSWMALTGLWLYLYLEPGVEARGWLDVVEEAHELGEGLIPLFLVVHVGAAIIHALAGHSTLRKMFFFR